MNKSEDSQDVVQVEQANGSQNGEDAAVEATDEPVQHVHAKTIILLIAVVGVYFVQVSHVTAAGLLANDITAITGGTNRATWLTSTIAISAGTLGPPVSQAADYWGRKWFLVVLTITGSVGCLIVSRADSFGMLIAGQSIGSLAMGAQPLVHAIASEILPRKNRPLAQAAANVAAGLGGIVGLLMGGGLTRTNPGGFRTYFYIMTALYALLAVIVSWLYNPPLRELQQKLTEREKFARLDWYGYAFFMPGLILFSFALTSASGVYPWKSSKIIAPLIVGIILLVVFGIYEWKFTEEGLLHHKLFSRGRNFVLAELCVFVEGMIFFAANQYYGFEVAVVYDKSLFQAGLYYTVAWYGLIISTITTGIYCSWTKTVRAPLMLAFVLFTTFCALMASLNPSTQWRILGYAPLFGVGIGTALNTIVTTAQLSTPRELISLTSGLIIGTRSVGGTVGLSIFTAIFSSVLGKQLPSKVIAATVPLGFDPKYLGMLLGGLTTGNSTLLGEIPGVNPSILHAAGSGVKEAYALGFRYVWICAAAFAAAALLVSAFIINPKAEFNLYIDAPVETEEELRRKGLIEKLHHQGDHTTSV